MSPYLTQRDHHLPRFLIRLTIFILFWLAVVVTVIYIMGFEIDLRHWRIKETGTIYLASSIGKLKSTITINNKLNATELPATFSRLKNGWYQVVITKENFIDWRKTVEVIPSKVNVQNSILLIKKKIEIREANEAEKQLIAKVQDEPLDQTIKILNNNELFINDDLVTRFSQDIENALWHPDGAHIVYQIGSEIRIIETDGLNDIRLATLQNPNPTIFRFLRKGQELLYQDGDKVLVARLYD